MFFLLCLCRARASTCVLQRRAFSRIEVYIPDAEMILSYFLFFPFFFFFFFVMKLDAVEWLGNVSLRAKNEGLRVRFNVKFLVIRKILLFVESGRTVLPGFRFLKT